MDPPYWRQSRGKYSDAKTDLGNMELLEFTKTLAGIVNAFAKKLPSGAAIALMIAPSRDENGKFIDHLLDVSRLVTLPVDMRIEAPYSSEQCEPQQVNWAKKHRTCLILSREIVVWRIE